MGEEDSDCDREVSCYRIASSPIERTDASGWMKRHFVPDGRGIRIIGTAAT